MGRFFNCEAPKNTAAIAARRSLEQDRLVGASSVAFPCISTGVFGYPLEAAAGASVSTVVAWLTDHPEIDDVLCTFDAEASAAIGAALAAQVESVD